MDGADYRLWSRPLVASDNVVVVTADALILARVALKELPAAEAGVVRGEGATVIPLGELRQVLVGRQQPMMQLFHGSGPTLTEVFFDDAKARDEVIVEMARRLGPGWRLDDRDRTQPLTLAMLMALFVGLTAALYFATRQAEARTASGAGFEMVADSVGSLGVLLIGGAFCLLALGAMVWTHYFPPKTGHLSLTKLRG